MTNHKALFFHKDLFGFSVRSYTDYNSYFYLYSINLEGETPKFYEENVFSASLYDNVRLVFINNFYYLIMFEGAFSYDNEWTLISQVLDEKFDKYH